MNMQLELTRNQVIESTEPGTGLFGPHRVLSLGYESEPALLFRLRSPFKRPIRLPRQILLDGCTAGRFRVIAFPLPDVLLLPDNQLADRDKQIRDKWWSKLEPLLGEDLLPSLLGDFGASIASFARQALLTKKAVYRCAYRYFYYGCVPNAFLPRFDLCGGAGQKRIAGPSKMGRPRDTVRLGHDEADVGVNVTAADELHFYDAMKKYWASGEHYPFKETYVRLCQDCYAWSGKSRASLPKNIPSYRQFVDHSKRLPQYPELLKRRITETKWERNYRAVLGRSSSEVLGPAERYQIDATVADVYLTSVYNRNWIIGRPVVYVVVDVFSGKIVGLYVGLEGPSWEGARLTLLNAYLDKSEYLALYGFGPDVEWDAHHISMSVMADRAELLSHDARGLVSGLGIKLDIAAAYRPDWKGIVERKFGILNDTIIHFTPGAVLRRIRERGERNHALDGTLNLREFTIILIREVLHFNSHHRQLDRLTPAMIAMCIQSTPNALWDFGMKHLIGGTPYRTKDEIYAHLLPQDWASVREDGIHFRGLRYTSPIAMQGKWFEKARFSKSFQIHVRYHAETPSRLWIIGDPVQGMRSHIHEATLIDPFNRYINARLEEAQDLVKFESLQNSGHMHDDLEAVINKNIQNDGTIGNAKEDLRATKNDVSNTKKIKNIRDHRRHEKQRMREDTAAREMAKFGRNGESSSVADNQAVDAPMSPMEKLIWDASNTGEDAP